MKQQIANDYLFYFKTVQASAIKTLFDSLKDLLDDTVLRIEEDGVKIMTIDGRNTVIVHLKLDASSFEEYYCESPRKVGINIPSLYKLIKTIGNNDVLTFYMEDETKLIIEIENANRNIRDISRLNALALSDTAIHIPNIEFDSHCRISSNEFQKYCRDLNNISDNVTIEIRNDTFVMTATGDIGEKEIILGETKDTLVFDKNNGGNIQNSFNLNFLCLFARSSNLCSELQLFIKKDKPLVLVYPIANLGTLKYVLASRYNPDE